MTFSGRDAVDGEALLTDRYLETLLAAGDRQADDVPADVALDPFIRTVASRLRRDLQRVHPSFRFEERLAVRLAEAARSMALAPAAGAEGGTRIVPLATALLPQAPDDLTIDLAPVDSQDRPLDPEGSASARSRPLLIGGALTSAALSLAGAAFVAWRMTRPPRSPMVRAARRARAARRSGTGLRLRLD